MVQRIVDWLGQRSKTSLTVAGVILVSVIAVLDHSTPTEMTFTISYLFPVLLFTWFVGRRQGIFISFVCAFAWLIVNLTQLRQGWNPLAPYWNAFNGLVAFLAVVFLASAVKTLNAELEERVERRTAELQASEQQFRQLAEGIHEVFWMTDVERSRVIYVSPGYASIWGRTCESLYTAPDSRLEAVHPEDRERVMQAAMTSQLHGGRYDEEYRIIRPDQTVRWIHDQAFPIYDKAGVLYRIGGIAEDITDRKLLERQILEVGDQEQRRIGRDLHDGLCQHLSATMFACKIVEEELDKKSLPEAAQVRQIAEFIDRAISQARDVAEGLDPVKVDANGFMSALEELTTSIQSMHRIQCSFRSDSLVLIDDTATAIHLYRIAQEAVNNAIRHGRATSIEIGLTNLPERVILTVQDNGIGISKPPTRRGGMGMHTMRYRARMLGASFDVSAGAKGGTIVTCALPKSPVAKTVEP
ncbi:MAG TPA: PAS domain-containing protein [Verrucomicrobiae bacterium]|nr:PAS domain-containing protein [Verrucomicrobiae bacterium]